MSATCDPPMGRNPLRTGSKDPGRLVGYSPGNKRLIRLFPVITDSAKRRYLHGLFRTGFEEITMRATFADITLPRSGVVSECAVIRAQSTGSAFEASDCPIMETPGSAEVTGVFRLLDPLLAFPYLPRTGPKKVLLVFCRSPPRTDRTKCETSCAGMVHASIRCLSPTASG